jgi:hypothetical protein
MQTPVGTRHDTFQKSHGLGFAGKGLELYEVGRDPLVEIVKPAGFLQSGPSVGLLLLQPQQGFQLIPKGTLFAQEFVEVQNHQRSMTVLPE